MTTTSLEHPTTTSADLAPEGRKPLLREAWDELKAVRRYRPLIRYLVISSLKKEHANTVLGFFWWILTPLLITGVYVIFVGFILKRGGPAFPVFILCAVLSWRYFSRATMSAIGSTLRKERSMRQVGFPRAIIPFSATLSQTARFGFGLLVLIGVAVVYGILPSPYLLLLVPIALVQLTFTLGLAFFLAALNIFVRDTSNFLQPLFRAGFYLSPGLYPVSAVPERFRDIYELNPFATLFPAYRTVVMEHAFPDFAALGTVAAASVVLLALGYLFFVRLQASFPKLV